MLSPRRLLLGLTLTTLVAAVAPPSTAQDSAAGAETVSVGAWDVRVVSGQGESPPQCGFSQTLLADPGLGAGGGRITIAFARTGRGFAADVVITGGFDDRPGVEILVDGRRMAAAVGRDGVLTFSRREQDTLLTMFRAGDRAQVHFYRSGRVVEVTFSLTGFTGASRTTVSRCP